jgi:choline kinase
MQAEGDIVLTYDPNWRELWTLRFEDPLSDAETFRLADNQVIEIGNRADSLDEIEGQYMGLLKFTPAGWKQVREHLDSFDQEERDRMDMTRLLQGLIQSGTRIMATPIQDRWFEVDSEEDLRRYEERHDPGAPF